MPKAQWRFAPIAALLLAAACTAGSTDTSTTETAPPVTTVAVTSTTAQPITTTSSTSTTSPASTTTTTLVDSNQVADGSGCTPGSDDLPDGRWFGFVEELGDSTMSFDLACWFSGVFAVIAAAEDGEESPPPNDYYIRNQNSLIRELPVDPFTPVVFYPTGDPNDFMTIGLDEWEVLAAERGGFFFGVWVTIEDGEVLEIEENWVP